MKKVKFVRVTIALLAAFLLIGQYAQFSYGIEDHVPITKEAEATRAGAPYNWDMSAIRKSLETRAAEIKYTEAGKDVVTILPTSHELKKKTTEELFDMCRHWNPTMVSVVGAELGRRSISIYDQIIDRSTSSDSSIRAACGQVIAGMLSSARTSGKDSEISKFVNKNSDSICKMITALIRDKDVLVRRYAFKAYGGARILKGDVSALANAAMQQAAIETDGHLCQQIILSTKDNRWDRKLDKKNRADILSKVLLKQPFPRGRGTVVWMISKLEPDEIMKTMPALYKHYSTPLLRDTMFFPGGAPEAFVLLAKYRKSNPEIFKRALAHADTFNRQPWVAFHGKYARSMKPYGEAIAELGTQAKSVIPSLEVIKKKTQKKYEIAVRDLNKKGQKQLQEALDYTNSIIERISK